MRLGSNMRSIAGSLSNAAYVLTLQVVALLVLDPASFGVFSLAYLGFALSSSLAMSLISEAWLRKHRNDEDRDGWRDYGAVSLYFAASAGLIALIVFCIVPILREVAVISAISVFASTYRACARYFVVRMRGAPAGIPGDLAGAGVFLATVALGLPFFGSNLDAVMVAWMSGAVATLVASGRPSLAGPAVIRTWSMTYSKEIRALLGDSLLSNVSAVGTPIVIAPVLGIAAFGVYRALGSIAAPIRLLIVPLAPVIARRPLSDHFTLRWGLSYVTLSLGLGTLAGLVLVIIQVSETELGVVGALSSYWLAGAIFIAANFFGHLTSIIARAWVPTRMLIALRGWHTGLGVVLPIGGALLSGISGAIWGLTASIVAASIVWIVALVYLSRKSS